MATVLVPVLKPLTYQGRSYVRGQSVRVQAVEALAMARRGEVTLSRDAVVSSSGSQLQARELVAESQHEPPVRRRRTYRRRDMTAEPAGE